MCLINHIKGDSMTNITNFFKKRKTMLLVLILLSLYSLSKLVLPALLPIIINPALYPYEYKYENIILRSAKLTNHKETSKVLNEVLLKIKKSSLYDENENYIVNFSNNKITQFLYFMPDSLRTHLGRSFNNKSFNDYSYNAENNITEGYIKSLDPKGTAYVIASTVVIVVESDGIAYETVVPVADTIAHEICHQMVAKSINNPIKLWTSYKKDKNIHEGYACLIVSGMDIDYTNSDWFLSSYYSIKSEHIHSDGSTHICDYLYKTYDYEQIIFGYYSLSNMFIVEKYLENNDILDVLRDESFRFKKVDIDKLFYDYLTLEGYEKVDNQYHGISEGEWLRIICKN